MFDMAPRETKLPSKTAQCAKTNSFKSWRGEKSSFVDEGENLDYGISWKGSKRTHPFKFESRKYELPGGFEYRTHGDENNTLMVCNNTLKGTWDYLSDSD